MTYNGIRGGIVNLFAASNGADKHEVVYTGHDYSPVKKIFDTRDEAIAHAKSLDAAHRKEPKGLIRGRIRVSRVGAPSSEHTYFAAPTTNAFGSLMKHRRLNRRANRLDEAGKSGKAERLRDIATMRQTDKHGALYDNLIRNALRHDIEETGGKLNPFEDLIADLSTGERRPNEVIAARNQTMRKLRSTKKDGRSDRRPPKEPPPYIDGDDGEYSAVRSAVMFAAGNYPYGDRDFHRDWVYRARPLIDEAKQFLKDHPARGYHPDEAREHALDIADRIMAHHHEIEEREDGQPLEPKNHIVTRTEDEMINHGMLLNAIGDPNGGGPDVDDIEHLQSNPPTDDAED